MAQLKEWLLIPEVKQKEKQTKSTPEYQEKMKIYNEAHSLAFDRHPDILQKMSEIAEDFPDMAKLIEKHRQGIPFTKNETIRRKTFFKECSLKMPGYQKIIDREYHKILVEWGIKEE